MSKDFTQRVILTDEKIKAITDETNKRIYQKFPMIEYPIKEWMVEEILKTLKEIKCRLKT